MISEQTALKKLNINDFSEIDEDNAIDLFRLLNNMEPDVATRVINQIPNFSLLIAELIENYKDMLNLGLKSNDKSVMKSYETYDQIIEVLNKQLENDNLTFDEKKDIMQYMIEIADKVDKKDSENKKTIVALAAIGAGILTVLVGGVLISEKIKKDRYLVESNSIDDSDLDEININEDEIDALDINEDEIDALDINDSDFDF